MSSVTTYDSIFSDWPKFATVLAQLEGLYTYCTAQNVLSVVPGPFGIVSEETRAGNRTHLAVIRRYLDKLGPSGELGNALMTGEITAARWSNVANEQGRGLNEVLKSLDEDSDRFWTEVVITTGNDVVTVTKNVAAAGGISLIVVALIYLVLKATK